MPRRRGAILLTFLVGASSFSSRLLIGPGGPSPSNAPSNAPSKAPTLAPSKAPSASPSASNAPTPPANSPYSADLPTTWVNPVKREVRCRNYAHHWTSIGLYAGIKSTAECDNGMEVQTECHGGGAVLGLYRYVEGYEGWDSLPTEGDAYSLVCSGIDLALVWNIMGPMNGCAIWKDGKQVGAYHGTWRGGGLDARALLWGYHCKVKRVYISGNDNMVAEQSLAGRAWDEVVTTFFSSDARIAATVVVLGFVMFVLFLKIRRRYKNPPLKLPTHAQLLSEAEQSKVLVIKALFGRLAECDSRRMVQSAWALWKAKSRDWTPPFKAPPPKAKAPPSHQHNHQVTRSSLKPGHRTTVSYDSAYYSSSTRPTESAARRNQKALRHWLKGRMRQQGERALRRVWDRWLGSVLLVGSVQQRAQTRTKPCPCCKRVVGEGLEYDRYRSPNSGSTATIHYRSVCPWCDHAACWVCENASWPCAPYNRVRNFPVFRSLVSKRQLTEAWRHWKYIIQHEHEGTDQYVALLRMALADDDLDFRENKQLTVAKRKYNVSETEHQQMVAEIRRENRKSQDVVPMQQLTSSLESFDAYSPKKGLSTRSSPPYTSLSPTQSRTRGHVRKHTGEDQYLDLLKIALADGVLHYYENKQLETARLKYNISESEHEQMLVLLQRAKAKETTAQPPPRSPPPRSPPRSHQYEKQKFGSSGRVDARQRLTRLGVDTRPPASPWSGGGGNWR
jgi:hypothetical protein